MTSDLGSTRIRRTIEAIPDGFDYVQRARRRDPLDTMKLTDVQRAAAIRWRLAAQHVGAGGARPPKGTQTPRTGETAPSGQLWPQERAMRDAEIYRIGCTALGRGQVAALAWLVLVEERPCYLIDRATHRRIGTAARMLSGGLHRLARAYRLESGG